MSMDTQRKPKERNQIILNNQKNDIQTLLHKSLKDSEEWQV